MNPETYADNMLDEMKAVGVPPDKAIKCCIIALKKMTEDTTTAKRIYYTSCIAHLKQKNELSLLD